MLRIKGLRRRESLRPEGMPSWIAPLSVRPGPRLFPAARYFGRQRHEHVRGDGEQEGFPSLSSTLDTLFPLRGDTARPDHSELPPHPSPGAPHSGTDRAVSVPQPPAGHHHSQGCQ